MAMLHDSLETMDTKLHETFLLHLKWREIIQWTRFI